MYCSNECILFSIICAYLSHLRHNHYSEKLIAIHYTDEVLITIQSIKSKARALNKRAIEKGGKSSNTALNWFMSISTMHSHSHEQPRAGRWLDTGLQ